MNPETGNSTLLGGRRVFQVSVSRWWWLSSTDAQLGTAALGCPGAKLEGFRPDGKLSHYLTGFPGSVAALGGAASSLSG